MMNGDQKDNNSIFSHQGYASPVIGRNRRSTTETYSSSVTRTARWDNQEAQTTIEQNSPRRRTVNAVFAANDGLGQAMI